jgi:hypothetical protein
VVWLVVCCFVFLLMIPVGLFLLTYIYRWSCVLCGLPRPSVLVAAGIMFVAWVSLVMAVSVLREIVHASCTAAGLPRWEAGIITTLLALPVDLMISAGIESGLMGVRFGKGVEMWYTQRLIQLSIVAVIGLIIALVVLYRQFN